MNSQWKVGVNANSQWKVGKKKEEKEVNEEKIIIEPQNKRNNSASTEQSLKMEKEAYQATLELINDAIRIYQRKLTTKHKQIFSLEEDIRDLTEILNGKITTKNKKEITMHTHNTTSINNSPQRKQKTKELLKQKSTGVIKAHKDELNEEEEKTFFPPVPVPIDVNELKTCEQAKEAYNNVLLYYLEHQSVLDSIICQKQSLITDIEEQIKELYNTVDEFAQYNNNYNNNENNFRQEEYSNKSGKDYRVRGLTNILKRKGSISNIRMPHSSPSTPLLLSNKDIVPVKKSSSLLGLTYEDFVKKRRIGKGAFGTVYLVEKKNTGQLLAMKVMKKKAIMSDPDSLRHVIMELEFMKQLSHHPFIVSLHSSFQTDTDVSLVMEWVGGGSLFDFLANYNRPFSEDIAKFYSAQVLLALQTLHSNDIAYRDLKLENILLDDKGYIRLSDFGLSARAKKGERIHSFSGTATYLAPEIIIDNGDDGHDKGVDLWCFGVMLYIMLTLEPPFWAEHYPDLFYLIRNKEVNYSDHPDISPTAVNLLQKLLTKDPRKRIGCGPLGIAEVQMHPFFEGFDWKSLLAKKIPAPFQPPIYKGKKLEEEEEEEDNEEAPPVDLFKGFSFVWNPDESDDLLSEQIKIFQQKKPESKQRKNQIVANFFVWIKEIHGIRNTKEEDQLFAVRWKHEAKKHVTTIGPESEPIGQTDFVPCKGSSIEFEGEIHNSCTPFDYTLLQDRKTLEFDSRPITFSLISAVEPKKHSTMKKPVVLDSFTLDISDFCYHKFEKTQIFAFENTGYTAVISIICSWRTFNGDIVDNHEKRLIRSQNF